MIISLGACFGSPAKWKEIVAYIFELIFNLFEIVSYGISRDHIKFRTQHFFDMFL